MDGRLIPWVWQAPYESWRAMMSELAKRRWIKVGGSFARGAQHATSDVDFIVTGRTDELRRDRMQEIVGLFAKHRIQWDSCVVGSISTPRNLDYLPIPIEVMDCCWIKPTPKADRLERVSIYGFEFSTY